MNIYEEMTVDDLKLEYQKTKQEKYHIRAEVRNGYIESEKV